MKEVPVILQNILSSRVITMKRVDWANQPIITLYVNVHMDDAASAKAAVSTLMAYEGKDDLLVDLVKKNSTVGWNASGSIEIRKWGLKSEVENFIEDFVVAMASTGGELEDNGNSWKLSPV